MELLTPGGVAGIAVLRAGAAERPAVLASLRTPHGDAFSPARSGPRRAVLVLGDRDLDDVLVIDRGAAGLELHVHGAPAVLAVIAQRFGVSPAVDARPAAQLLRQALGVAQLDVALEQLAYDFDCCLQQLAALPQPARALARDAALERSRVGIAHVRPQRVVLVGRQNAGKSSLFNALAARERALTGPIAGLTRDPVREATVLGGYPCELVDTAGEGGSVDALDAAAIRRGRAERAQAIVVLVVDRSVGPAPLDERLLADSDLVVAAKGDLPPAAWPAGFPLSLVSSVAGEGAAQLRRAFGELLRRHRRLPPAGPLGGFAALDDGQLRRLSQIAG
jgi:tRNA U34 5-carboxymethylaminomethyl modifying GTPase MnmE/TrmE